MHNIAICTIRLLAGVCFQYNFYCKVCNENNVLGRRKIKSLKSFNLQLKKSTSRIADSKVYNFTTLKCRRYTNTTNYFEMSHHFPYRNAEVISLYIPLNIVEISVHTYLEFNRKRTGSITPF